MKWLVLALFLSGGADLVSTELAVSKPGVYERNPLLRSRPVRVGVKIAYPFVVWQAGKRVGGKREKALLIGATAVWSLAAVKNFQIVVRF